MRSLLTGFHPETISIYLKADGPPTRRRVPDEALVMNARWKERVAALIGTYPRLLGISRAPGLPESCHPCKPSSLGRPRLLPHARRYVTQSCGV